MDWTHITLLVIGLFQVAALVVIVRALVIIQATALQVEESNKQIAEMANRNERKTQSILQKVYDVTVQQ